MTAGLLTYSLPETFPTPTNVSGKSILQEVEWSSTAAGLSGIFTRFPFNPSFETKRKEPILSQR